MPKNLVKPISFRGQDEELYLHLCKQPNVSEYVRELIRRDINGITSEDSQPNELLIEIRDLILNLRERGVSISNNNESDDDLYESVLNLINLDWGYRNCK